MQSYTPTPTRSNPRAARLRRISILSAIAIVLSVLTGIYALVPPQFQAALAYAAITIAAFNLLVVLILGAVVVRKARR